MPTKLSVYNGALRLLGKTRLDDTDEDDKAAVALSDAWDDVVRGCFEEYPWNFAAERAQLELLETTPVHTFTSHYAKPADWLATINITVSANDDDKLIAYSDEAGGATQPKGVIATSSTSVYLRYISDLYITRIGNWSQKFADYVAAKLAQECCQEITGNTSKMEDIDREKRKRKHEATNWDSRQNPMRVMPPGRLVRARLGGRGWASNNENG